MTASACPSSESTALNPLRSRLGAGEGVTPAMGVRLPNEEFNRTATPLALCMLRMWLSNPLILLSSRVARFLVSEYASHVSYSWVGVSEWAVERLVRRVVRAAGRGPKDERDIVQ